MSKIAIVSDLHVGDAARASDFKVNDSSGALDVNYLEQFQSFVKNNSISADALIISGDITNKATFDEFKLASDIVREISNALCVTQDSIFYVPGNHDRNWALVESSAGANESTSIRLSYSALMTDEGIFSDLVTNGNGAGRFDEDPFIVKWESDQFVVVGINSATHDNPDDDVHYGLIRSTTTQALDDMASALMDDSRIKILLVHHHPIQYPDPMPEEPDFSQMVDAADLLKVLSKNRFDILIHGHKHDPNLTTQTISDGHPIVIVGAGSFSSVLDPRWSGKVANQFHLLDIVGRSGESNFVKGRLNSWTYLCAHGWTRSQDTHHGINHSLGFGSYHIPKDLSEKITEIIDSIFNQSNVCSWEEIVAEDENLEFVHEKAVLNAISEYCVKNGKKMLGEEGLTEMHIVNAQ